MKTPAGFILVLLIASSAPVQASIHTYVKCQNSKIVRTIRVKVLKDGSCETIYTKAGVDRSVGEGQFLQSCLNFLNNVKSNLEETKMWACKDLNSSQVTVTH